MVAPLNPPIRDWAARRVWLVGASSGIGAALAGALLARGARVALSARSPEPLAAIAARAADPANALTVPLDVLDAAAVRRAHERIVACWGGVDTTIWLAGTYTPMQADDFDLDVARHLVDTNLAVLNGLATLLPAMLREGAGSIAIVSSVAGYRGLPRSLLYGPTKAALINLAEALYLELHPRGIGVHLINPGFVETPLTARNDFRMPALISAQQAADEILAGLARGDFEIHFPRRFTRLLRIMRRLPDRWYFALVRRATQTSSKHRSATEGKDR